VQDALGLTADQNRRLTTLLSTWKQAWEVDRERFSRLDEDARRRRIVVIAEEHEQALAQLLSARQRQRLTEIVIQDQGIFAFKDPHVEAALGLSSPQRKRIRQIEHEIFRHGRGHGPGGIERMTKKESVDKVLADLSEDQVRKWRELTGAPFEGLDEPRRPGRRDAGLPPEPGGRRGERGGGNAEAGLR
jgi:hypothetical protein